MSLLIARSLMLGIWILPISQNDLLAQQHPVKVQYEISKKFINSNDILNIPIPFGYIQNVTKMTVFYQGGKALRYFETEANFSENRMPIKYSFVEADSGYYFIEDPENENLYKCAFPSRILHRSNQRKSFLSIDCEEYFNVSNADTSFYYLTDKLPKSAGVTQLKDTKSCILGISDKNVSIFPISFSEQKMEFVNLPSKKVQVIKSLDSNLVVGSTGSISIGKEFPHFVATDIFLQKISNVDFAKYNCSIVVFWDKIKSRPTGNPKKIEYDGYYNGQIEEILVSLDSIWRLGSIQLFTFSTEYLENISRTNYDFLKRLQYPHFITNSEQWQGLLDINADPLVIFVDDKGYIKEILTPLDFPEEKLVDFFITRISEKGK